MKTYHRNYLFESNDFEKLCNYVISANSVDKKYFDWHIGRIVDWKYNLSNFNKHFPDNFNHAAELWFDSFHNLIGFVISEDFNQDFSILLNKKYSFLYPEMMNWVKKEWALKYDRLSTQVLQTQTDYIRHLENEGYKRTDDLEMTRVFDTIHYKNYTFDDSYITFMSMEENGDYEEQAVLRTNAWPKTYDWAINLQIKEYTRCSPIYNASFDFVLVDHNGKQLSGCEAFIDYENNTAEIERVCTHSDYYNRGYAQIVLKSCMRRLYEYGILTAFISGSYDKTLHLYGKLNHTSEYARYSYVLSC